MGRALTVVLHDVSPATWPACLRVMTAVRRVARREGKRLPMTLLVVPAMHGEPATPAFVRSLRYLVGHGHELALHGLTHSDDAPPRSSWLDHVRRRWYTDGEGEFSALDRSEATRRLALGRAWATLLRLPMRGFVAPAWLLSEASWEAVESAGFAYTCTLNEVVALPGRQGLHARSVVFSTRSAWRRLASVVWNTLLAGWQQRAPLLRLELHPHDADHAAVLRCWSRILARALRDGRRPLRLDDVARQVQVRAHARAIRGSGPRDPATSSAAAH
ncbi:MAG TPA: polysaccharide deacetylase family protein [Ideonella sp.]|uniref:polysaccharide deacetylase family protein n=1 Tax=Ideonella sp. TaxID=1929293 RepID=UPI002E34CC1C|nr:polysaccharide deacetylase family protein [Ideonella sp.]HEX5686236.1 polysaccharide deacetylase family protein [Ideonella sp.]